MAWLSASSGRTATIFALGWMLGTAMFTRKLAAVAMSMAGQIDAMVFRMDSLLTQLHATLGRTTTELRPSALCAVYLIAAPLPWHPWGRAMVPAYFQSAGISI